MKPVETGNRFYKVTSSVCGYAGMVKYPPATARSLEELLISKPGARAAPWSAEEVP
jgi:hypothetical protein